MLLLLLRCLVECHDLAHVAGCISRHGFPHHQGMPGNATHVFCCNHLHQQVLLPPQMLLMLPVGIQADMPQVGQIAAEGAICVHNKARSFPGARSSSSRPCEAIDKRPCCAAGADTQSKADMLLTRAARLNQETTVTSKGPEDDYHLLWWVYAGLQTPLFCFASSA